MAKNQVETIGKNIDEITANDVTSISVQNHSSVENLYLYPSVDGAAPDESTGYAVVPPGQWVVNEALADLWPGVDGANRVFARASRLSLEALVSHA